MKKQKFTVTGMTCAACQANVTKTVAALPGVTQVDVNLLAGKMTVEYDEGTQTAEQIAGAVCKIGYGTKPEGERAERGGTFRHQWAERRERAAAERRGMKRRLIASFCFLIPLMYVSMGHMMGLPVPRVLIGTENAAVAAFTQLLLAAPVLILNRKFFTVGFKALINRAPNMDSLVALGSAASYIYSIFAIHCLISWSNLLADRHLLIAAFRTIWSTGPSPTIPITFLISVPEHLRDNH